MTEIEKFLASRELYRCERLAASITKEQCDKNKARKHNLATDIWSVGPCKGCSGLGEKVTMARGIKGKDVIAASGKSSKAYSLCDVPGCGKFRVIGHKCTIHGKEAEAAKKPLPVMTQFAVDMGMVEEGVIREALEVKPRNSGVISHGLDLTEKDVSEILGDDPPPVTDSEIHVINLIDVFKQKQAADLDVFIHELSQMPDPYSKLEYAYNRVTK